MMAILLILLAVLLIPVMVCVMTVGTDAEQRRLHRLEFMKPPYSRENHHRM